MVEQPGPGNYETIDPEKTRLLKQPNILISPIQTTKSTLEKFDLPGPGAYKPLVEYNTRVSHHYWLGDPSSQPWLRWLFWFVYPPLI